MGIPVNDDTEDVQPTSDQSEPFLYAILTESDSSDGTQGLLLAKTVPICVFDKEMLTEMAAGALFQAGETFERLAGRVGQAPERRRRRREIHT
jgi:hypothetical protein